MIFFLLPEAQYIHLLMIVLLAPHEFSGLLMELFTIQQTRKDLFESLKSDLKIIYVKLMYVVLVLYFYIKSAFGNWNP